MRIFRLERDIDVSGVSGTGVVARGVEFPDGTVALRWLGADPSTVFWASIDAAERIHGHGGATRVVWDDYQLAHVVDAKLIGLDWVHTCTVCGMSGPSSPPLPCPGLSLLEEGRRLASERENLIAQGVDPADIAVPIYRDPS